ncbi:MAG TPA: DUF5916 domain-containing protein, partial [Woeseiaceae bacterium]
TGEGGNSLSLGSTVTMKPSSNVSVTLGPNYNTSLMRAQYVRAIDDPTADLFYDKRYVFSDVDQTTLSMSTRLDVTFTPTMSLQLYAQPFISSNKFSNFKEYARPRDSEKLVYGRDVGIMEEQLTNNSRSYLIDPDGAGPAASFTIDDPNFTLRSLRGNAVFRWEYTPGSTLFLVWTQDRASQESIGEFDFNRDRRALFDGPAHHVFLIKVNYWLPL